MKSHQFSVDFTFNGNNYNLQTQKKWALKEVLYFFGFHKNIVVIEYNGKIVNFQQLKGINLKNHDKIELLTIVGGG